jgi:MraZ protein
MQSDSEPATIDNDLPVFAGTVRHVVDENHRVTVPSRWRHPGLSRLYAVPDPQQPSLVLMTADEMAKVQARVENDPAIPSSQARIFVRQLFSSASPCPMDKQGRLVLPAEECARLGLTGEVVLAGGGTRVEVWNPSQWAAQQVKEQSILTDIAERIGF